MFFVNSKAKNLWRYNVFIVFCGRLSVRGSLQTVSMKRISQEWIRRWSRKQEGLVVMCVVVSKNISTSSKEKPLMLNFAFILTIVVHKFTKFKKRLRCKETGYCFFRSSILASHVFTYLMFVFIVTRVNKRMPSKWYLHRNFVNFLCYFSTRVIL